MSVVEVIMLCILDEFVSYLTLRGTYQSKLLPKMFAEPTVMSEFSAIIVLCSVGD